jgi:hypothetical protein
MPFTLHHKANVGKRKFSQKETNAEILRSLCLLLFNSKKRSCREKICVHPCPSVVNFPPMPPPRKIPARQRVLAQWRGVDLSPLETAKSVRARPVGDVVSRVLTSLRIDDRRAEAELVKVWNSLIDPNIVAHAQPANLRKGTLFVNVDSSVWLSEIVRYRRKEILDRLQHSFGKNVIQKISYRVG